MLSLEKEKNRSVEKITYPIDFVVTWVDASDPEWLSQKEKYHTELSHSEKKDNSSFRYREWGMFRYWFRAVEQYAPWVRYVWLVTCGHTPEWLNTEHPKLRVVRHEDFIPKEYLPTFSSICIELNLWRISGLSEHFVYFNDDMYLFDNASTKRYRTMQFGLPHTRCDDRRAGEMVFLQIRREYHLQSYDIYRGISVGNNLFTSAASNEKEQHGAVSRSV